jgi:hypothetical protein
VKVGFTNLKPHQVACFGSTRNIKQDEMLMTYCVILALLVSTSAFAQVATPSFSDPTAPAFIVRLQRIQADRNVCAIVRGDGLFHVESEKVGRVDVSEGTLDQGELANLRTWINDTELAALTQNRIALPLVITEKDEFLISILRSPLTQNLTFMDRQSRKPFDNVINPLLHWIDALQHHPHTSLEEFAGRNNCLPPKKLEFSPRLEAPAAPKVSADSNSPETRRVAHLCVCGKGGEGEFSHHINSTGAVLDSDACPAVSNVTTARIICTLSPAVVIIVNPGWAVGNAGIYCFASWSRCADATNSWWRDTW